MDMSETPCQSKSEPRMMEDATELLEVLKKQSLANLKSMFGVSDAIARYRARYWLYPGPNSGSWFRSLHCLHALTLSARTLLLHYYDRCRLNHERYTNFDELDAKQAVLAFDGPAYKALGAPALTEADLTFAQDHMYGHTTYPDIK
eukprot:3666123-Pyramimonas_sp.AAC.2